MNKKFGFKAKDVGFIQTLQKRSTGSAKRPSRSYNLEERAEDVFVNKQFQELRCKMPNTPRSTFLMVFSPDGTRIASTHGNHNIYITDARTGKNISTLTGHPRTPWCIAFHPTSNQVLASGCLGGEVRVWDLSGGSEVWVSDLKTVVASIAFHPEEQILLIATCNELHFWDWSKEAPFLCITTGNIKEKVRYVAFDKQGTKLITGISNSPQLRWERVRAPVPVPRPADGSASPYRRRITPRLVGHFAQSHSLLNTTSTTSSSSTSNTAREPLSTVPERERRITACYRNLVREYELLVHRYLQIYRPPTMIDQGTDPMEEEIDLSTLTGMPTPSRAYNFETPSTSQGTSSDAPSGSTEPQPSTSSGIRAATSTSPNSPSARIFVPKNKNTTIGTQTISSSCLLSPVSSTSTENSRGSTQNSPGVDVVEEPATLTSSNVCALRKSATNVGSTEMQGTSAEGNSSNEVQSQESISPARQNEPEPKSSSRRILVISRDVTPNQPENAPLIDANSSYEIRTKVRCSPTRKHNEVWSPPQNNLQRSVSFEEPRPSTSGYQSRRSVGDIDETDNKYDAIKKRRRPGCLKKPTRLEPLLSSDTSSDEDGPYGKRPCTTAIGASSNLNNSNVSTPTPSTSSASQSGTSRRPLNFNAELEMLVTDLLADNNNSSQNNNDTEHSSRICSTCGVNVEESQHMPQNSNDCDLNGSRCARTNPAVCPRTANSTTTTQTTDSTVYTNTTFPRRRLLTYRLPTLNSIRLRNVGYPSRSLQSRISPSNRMWRSLYAYNQNRNVNTFASDEVINYSERVGSEEEGQEQQPANFHPFDAPPEFGINPENIGIGNMYSNIVQELESSLNDVRNLRPGNRLGETSDMLSSFSERLESIMNQSNAILRNLRTSIETLTPADPNPSPSTSTEPQVLFSDNSFYMRDQSNNEANNEASSSLLEGTSTSNLFANHNAVAADHTYPLNSRNAPNSTTNMSPLMASLHLTVTHIQRQARLLRQQVESIEQIDRAMLEVAQLQMLRQMFTELQRYFRSRSDGRHGVSSVRQMMAGARISDSSPYDSPNEEVSNSQSNTSEGTSGGVSASTSSEQTNPSQSRVARKTFPRCIFLMHRNFRRGSCGRGRRLCTRMRRQLYTRGVIAYSSASDYLRQNFVGWNPVAVEALRSSVRRLEYHLMEHGQNIGRVVEPERELTLTHREESMLVFRLNECRNRIFTQIGGNYSIRQQVNSVTADGYARYPARELLTLATEQLIRVLLSSNNFITTRSIISDALDLSLLLTEILLLQIVDCIPPPTGMNLDTERENLSTRIDQMCSRMLNRLGGNSQELTRSLRLTRLAIRHATNALSQTYTARRNSMYSPSASHTDPRRRILEEINTCLLNIRRHETTMRPDFPGPPSNHLTTSSWYQTIQRLISRYRHLVHNLADLQNPTRANEPNERQSNDNSNNFWRDSSDDDDEPPLWYTGNENESTPSRERNTPLYRTNNVNLFNLLNNEESTSAGTSSRSRPWNVPLVRVNDEPVPPSPSHTPPQQPSLSSFLVNRQRLSERFAELRTYPVAGLFRPRFLHPLYSGVPLEPDFDEAIREHIYDTTDMITPLTPNHRIQVWEFSNTMIPSISDPLSNIVVNECKIHNDASIDISNDGNLLVALLPTGGYLNGTTRLGVYSLRWESLGQCLYVANFEQNAVSVSLSPLNRHLVVGLASRRVSIIPSEKWIMARVFALDEKKNRSSQLVSARDVEQVREPNFMSVNCIRWLPVSGQGLVYGTNTGQLRILT